jgi:glycosyltransferase involved in cell wall biosynthesis
MVITLGVAGGGQQHVVDVCAELRRDHEILVACGEGDYLPAALDRLGVRWVRVPDLVRPVDPRRDARALAALLRVARGFGPDVVHAHTAKAGALARLLRPFVGRRVRIVYTPHNWSFNNPNDAGSSSLNLWIERALSRLADVTVCVSDAERRLALERRVDAPARLRVVYSGRALAPGERPAVPEPRDRFRLTWVGRMEGHKDPETVVEAVRLLPPDALARVEVVFVGSGDRLAAVEAASAGLPIRAVGASDNRTALAWIASGDAFVLSSAYEPFGLVILEALGLGIPVVASAAGGPSEILEDGVTGLLFPPGDAGALRDAVLRLMGDDGLRRRLRENGLGRFADFSPRATAEALRELYAA